MDEQRWENCEEEQLQQDLSALLPPEDVVKGTTPWRRAMRQILAGLILGTITFQFSWLPYLLPAAGSVLLWLGARTLRRENIGFRVFWLLTLMRTAYIYIDLLALSSIRGQRLTELLVSPGALLLSTAVMLAQIGCLGLGLSGVRKKAELPAYCGSIVALLVWYGVVCVLALVQYAGWLLHLLLLCAYFFLIRSLYRLSSALDEAGYLIKAAPVWLSNGVLALALAVALCASIVVGCVFSCQYPMDWSLRQETEQAQQEPLRQQLLDLGFPQEVLDDLSAEDLAECQGALRVVTTEEDIAVNPGRRVTTIQDGALVSTTEYDVKEMHMTGVAVELPGTRERWRIYHHFRWAVDPGFRGTDALQLWPLNEGWSQKGAVTGRVLCEREGQVYTAPYYQLQQITYQNQSWFMGTSTRSNWFAAFSFPQDGTECRGYVSYEAAENEDGWLMDSWANYVYQKKWCYPAQTGVDYRMRNAMSLDDVFVTLQYALQFDPNELEGTAIG